MEKERVQEQQAKLRADAGRWRRSIQDESQGHIEIVDDWWPHVTLQHADSDGDVAPEYQPDQVEADHRQVGCWTETCSNNLCMYWYYFKLLLIFYYNS